jgi:phosphopantothenoylcysteine decarboxylase
VVATQASTHFYTQEAVDKAIEDAVASSSLAPAEQTLSNDGGAARLGVNVWTDKDEWSVRIVSSLPLFDLSRTEYYAEMVALSFCGGATLTKQDWRKVGDPILHIEVSSRYRKLALM